MDGNDNQKGDDQNKDLNSDKDNSDETISISKKDYESLKSELEETKRAKNESYEESQKLMWIERIHKDPKSSFIKLYESDKRMADKVADHFNKESGDKYSAKEYYQMLKKEGGDSGSEIDEDELLEKMEKKMEIKKAGETYKGLLKEYKIDPDSKEGKQFKEEYDFIMGDRKDITPDVVKKVFAKALREVGGVDEIVKSKQNLGLNGLSGYNRAGIKPNGINHQAKTLREMYPKKAK